MNDLKIKIQKLIFEKITFENNMYQNTDLYQVRGLLGTVKWTKLHLPQNDPLT